MANRKVRVNYILDATGYMRQDKPKKKPKGKGKA